MNMMPNYLAAGLLIVAPLRSGIPTFTKSERVNGRLSGRTRRKSSSGAKKSYGLINARGAGLMC